MKTYFTKERKIQKADSGKDIRHLKKNVWIKGQLHPLGSTQSKKHMTRIGFTADDGRELYILSSRDWFLILWKHIWERVSLNGDLDYYKGTLDLHSINPENSSLMDDYEAVDDYNVGPDELRDLLRGYQIKSQGV